MEDLSEGFYLKEIAHDLLLKYHLFKNKTKTKGLKLHSWGANLVLGRLYSKGQNEDILLGKKGTELDSLCLCWLSKIRTFGRGQNKDVSLRNNRTELDSF